MLKVLPSLCLNAPKVQNTNIILRRVVKMFRRPDPTLGRGYSTCPRPYAQTTTLKPWIRLW